MLLLLLLLLMCVMKVERGGGRGRRWRRRRMDRRNVGRVGHAAGGRGRILSRARRREEIVGVLVWRRVGRVVARVHHLADLLLFVLRVGGQLEQTWIFNVFCICFI